MVATGSFLEASLMRHSYFIIQSISRWRGPNSSAHAGPDEQCEYRSKCHSDSRAMGATVVTTTLQRVGTYSSASGADPTLVSTGDNSAGNGGDGYFFRVSWCMLPS